MTPANRKIYPFQPPAGQFGTLTGSDTYLKLAQQQGYTMHLMVAGPRSHLTRSVPGAAGGVSHPEQGG